MKKISLILGLAIMLLLAGCSSGGSSGSSNTGSSGTFNGGDRALTFEFAEGAPPQRVRDAGLQSFTVRVLAENTGEYDIPANEAHVALSGFSPQDFNLIDVSQDLPQMRGVKKQGRNTIPGTKHQVLFSNMKYVQELPSGTHSQPIFANLCYPYKTKALATVCINGDTLISYDDKSRICDIEGKKDFANSGAPVTIENVEQFSAGESQIQIQFDIVHKPTKDNGRAYRSGVLDQDCKINGNAPSSTDSALEESYIQYEVFSGINGLECTGGGLNGKSNAGEVQLTNGRTTVFCTQDTTGQEEYEKPISITLTYDYLERIKTDLIIEHVGR